MGGEVVPTGGVHFRVWAPEHKRVEVEFAGDPPKYSNLTSEDNGYWSGLAKEARAGMRYKYRLNGKDSYPDPASRFQPDGPHFPSQIIDPTVYAWEDRAWRGLGLRGVQVVVERLAHALRGLFRQ